MAKVIGSEFNKILLVEKQPVGSLKEAAGITLDTVLLGRPPGWLTVRVEFLLSSCQIAEKHHKRR